MAITGASSFNQYDALMRQHEQRMLEAMQRNMANPYLNAAQAYMDTHGAQQATRYPPNADTQADNPVLLLLP